MDALAFGATIIAFLQIADRVIHLTKLCVEVLHDCPREIRTVLVEVSSLKAVLENLDFLSKHSCGHEPHLIQQLAGEHGPVEQCRRSVKELETLLPSKIDNKDSKRKKILAVIAWSQRRSSIKELLDNISRYKLSMVLALTYDSSRDIKDIKDDLRQVRESLTCTERNEICSWLETTNPSGNHNNALKLHEDGTGLWLIRSTKWKQWLEGKIRFLWLRGIPGAGKTVLTSFLIEQAQIALVEQNLIAWQQKPVFCVYYYCHFSRNQDETIPFLRWLVSQLCRKARLVPNQVYRIFQLGHVLTISQLLIALEVILNEFRAVLVIIDAVDESKARQDLLQILRDFMTDRRFETIRLLATSRDYSDIKESFLDISTQISVAGSRVDEDIQRYVHSALSPENFQRWPPKQIVKVERALAEGAKGMFRWAACQIHVLQRVRWQEDIDTAISNLPKDLDQTYERILDLIPEEDRDFVRLALIFICSGSSFCHEGISSDILLQAIFFRLKNDYDSRAYSPVSNNGNILRDACGCLVSFSNNNGREVVTIAHYTVKEFLYSPRIVNSGVKHFALSNQLVRSTFLRTLLEFMIQKHRGLNAINPESLPFFRFSVEALSKFRDTTKGDQHLEALVATFKILETSEAYRRSLNLALLNKRIP